MPAPHHSVFSARCNISRLCYDVSVRLSVTEVHWRIIANLGFRFRSKFTAHCGRGEGNLNNNMRGCGACGRKLFIVQCARGEGSSPGRVEGSSRAKLATARPSCYRLDMPFLLPKPHQQHQSTESK